MSYIYFLFLTWILTYASFCCAELSCGHINPLRLFGFVSHEAISLCKNDSLCFITIMFLFFIFCQLEFVCVSSEENGFSFFSPYYYLVVQIVCIYLKIHLFCNDLIHCYGHLPSCKKFLDVFLDVWFACLTVIAFYCVLMSSRTNLFHYSFFFSTFLAILAFFSY